MNTRIQLTVFSALAGAVPGVIGILLVWMFAGCAEGPGAPGMVCYDIEHFLFRVMIIAAVVGCATGALFGLWLGRRRTFVQR